MATLQLTDEQVLDLLKQLPPEQEGKLFGYLLQRQQRAWEDNAAYFEEGARRAARARGRDWDAMTEEEREDFIDEIVHEDRPCSSS